ncbi:MULTISPECIES: glycosyltransferase [unclassified Agromyces]|uniref:glycosyltransferase n=1 Tax=unclassified Agromyces TaxID=2639701 RepID=UPI003014B518
MFPRVTAVLVVQHGGDRLRATLDAIRAQRRPVDGLAVVLMRSDEATRALVEAAHPARVVQLESPLPFGDAVRTVETTLEPPRTGDDALWLLSEDAAPEPGALEALAGALSTARTAAVAVPKLVVWDEPGRILRFGRSVTRSGRSLAIVEDELDQGQHDDLSDVLGGDPAGMLVRQEVWRSLDGFDPALPTVDDGLDLGARARLAGHRVVAVPAARLRFADDGVAGPGSEAGGRAARRRAREARAARLHRRLAWAPAVLVPLHWLALLPVAVGRSLRHLLVKTPGAIPGEFRAAVGVMARPARVAQARRRLAATRSTGWRSVAPLRIRRDEVRLRRQQAAEARRQRARGRVEDVQFLATGGGWVLLGALVASGVLFAPLLAAGGIAGGTLLPLSDDLTTLWRNAAYGWRDVDGGFTGAADPFAGVLALLGSAAFWDPSWALLALWLVAIPLSSVGGWFAVARLTERTSLRVLGGALWAAAPPLLDSLAAGRPGAVIVHLLLPCLAVLMFAAATSWAAAAAASLVFAVVIACAPSLAPALLLAWIVSLALSGRAAVRLAGIPIPALAVFLPLVVDQVTRGTPLGLLADPGVPQPSTPPSEVQAAFGQASGTWGRWEDAFGGLVVAAVPAPLVLAALLAPLAIAAAAVVASRRYRGGLLALALAALGYATAVATSHVAVAAAGERPVVLWTGAALSLMWFGLVAAVVLALDALPRGAAPVAALVGILAVAAVAPTLVALALGRTAVGPAPERTLPAFVVAEAATDPRVGTLRLEPTADGGIRSSVERGSGATLDVQSTLAATREELTPTTEAVASLAGNLASRSGYDAGEDVERLGLTFVLLAPAGDDAAAAAVEQRARVAMDANPQVLPLGETDFGALWRFTDARPDSAGARIPEPPGYAAWIVAGQLVVLGSALLLSIPTGGGREPDRRPPQRRRPPRRPRATPVRRRLPWARATRGPVVPPGPSESRDDAEATEATRTTDRADAAETPDTTVTTEAGTPDTSGTSEAEDQPTAKAKGRSKAKAKTKADTKGRPEAKATKAKTQSEATKEDAADARES